MGCATAASRSRRPSRSRRCGWPGCWSARPSSCCASRARPGVSTGELDAIAEEHIRAAAACRPSWATATRRSRRRSAPRSTTRSCTASRATGSCADGDVISIDCGAIVDGWHGDAAITVAVGEVRRRGRRADAGHRGGAVGRHRRRPARRPGHRHLARRRVLRPLAGAEARTASSRSSPGTASAPRCTSRRTCRTTAGPAAGPKLERGLALAVEPMVTLGSRHTDAATRTSGRSSPTTARWAAHFEHTFTLTPDGAWVLTALDGGRAPSSPSSACRYGGALTDRCSSRPVTCVAEPSSGVDQGGAAGDRVDEYVRSRFSGLASATCRGSAWSTR